jgi:hypothetical protein
MDSMIEAALLAAALMGAALGASAQTTPLPEIQVTTSAIPDYEFDWGRYGVSCATCNGGDGNARFVFTDASNNLWLGYINHQTGDFSPLDGHGVLLDTGAAKTTDFGNGPEWMYNASGSQVVYTKYAANQAPSALTAGVALASRANGVWSAGLVPNNPLGRNSPLATVDEGDTAARFAYVDANRSHQYWRSATDPGVEYPLPIAQISDGSSRRWVPHTHKIIFAGTAPPDASGTAYVQMFLYDTDAGTLEQLTFDPTNKGGGFMWQAPEFGNEYVFFTTTNATRLFMYRKLPDAKGVPRWTVAKSVTPPSALPYIFSAEPFVHNGYSYVFMTLSSTSDFTSTSVPSQLAITGIHPLIVNFKMLTNDSNVARVRKDPEYYITAQGPFIYYTRIVPSTPDRQPANDGVWRVDTLLGPAKASAAAAAVRTR